MRVPAGIQKLFISLNIVDKYPAMKLHPSITPVVVVGSSPTTS